MISSMKKIATCLLAGVLLLAGCEKKTDDSIKGESADQRLNEVLAGYQAKLTSATDGWILVELTNGTAINQGATTTGQSAAFAYYMQFIDSNSVTMFSDFDSAMSATPKTSSYRLKAVQRPALIFDTYSYIHVPCDPDPAISKSPFGPGLGWGADFEFSFADNVDPSQLGDTIHLTGNLNSTNAILVKATKAQHDAYYSGKVPQALFFTSILNYFKRVNVGGTIFEFTPALTNRAIDISWLDAQGRVAKSSSEYYQVGDGIFFVSPVNAGNITLTGIENIVFNAATSTGTATVNGTASNISAAIAPISIIESQPSNWYNAAYTANTLYVSPSGFHVNGVDDAFGLVNLSFNGLPFYVYVYYPAAFNGYDVFSPFFADTQTGGYPDYLPLAQGGENAGIAYFNVAPMAATPTAVTETNTLFTDAGGFYFILKEDGTTYDQVITSDAKSWISWQLLN
jgi:Domain of unknown function (DUF4302)